MNDRLTAVKSHYENAITDPAALLATIAAQLDTIDEALTAQRLSNFDQLHIGGFNATVELARRAGITPGMHVLDAGSGLGGPSRFLAETTGAFVDGVDLSTAFVEIARLLAERAGLADRVRYHAASITDLPFDDATFDLVWTQHVVMNIDDRDGVYREVRRVLKPGGRFVFYDPFAPDAGEPPIYPTPWAQTPETSTLLTKDETIDAFAGAGLELRTWDDVTEIGRTWVAAQAQAAQATAERAPRDGLHLGLVVGPSIQPMVANFARNLIEGRVRLVMGECRRHSS